MTVVVHLSDPHFGTVDERVREALIADVHRHPVDVVAITGDITQRARRRQFDAAAEFVDALPKVPALVVPGNHDLPLFDLVRRFTNPYGGYRATLGRELEPEWSDTTTMLVGVNSTRATRHKHGVLSADRIQRAVDRLARGREPFRVIALHHPLVVTLPEDAVNRARGADAALERWIQARADLFLGGHIHLPYCLLVHDSAGARPAVVLQAGTALSRRVRHGVPNSYNRIVLTVDSGRRSMCIERRDYDEATQAFHATHVQDAIEVDGRWTLHRCEPVLTSGPSSPPGS